MIKLVIFRRCWMFIEKIQDHEAHQGDEEHKEIFLVSLIGLYDLCDPGGLAF
jgi:hypothetical protein